MDPSHVVTIAAATRTLLAANILGSVTITACTMVLIVNTRLSIAAFVGRLEVSAVIELAITVAPLVYRFRRFC